MTVPVDGVKTLSLVLVSAVQLLIVVAVTLHTFPLTEQVTRECVVEQEDTRRGPLMGFMDMVSP